MIKILACAAVLTMSGAALAQTSFGEAAPQGATWGYPPCSASVTDRCIQLHEPAVRTNYSGMGGPESEMSAILSEEDAAAAPATLGTTGYPLCSARIKDRCRQTRG